MTPAPLFQFRSERAAAPAEDDDSDEESPVVVVDVLELPVLVVEVVEWSVPVELELARREVVSLPEMLEVLSMVEFSAPTKEFEAVKLDSPVEFRDELRATAELAPLGTAVDAVVVPATFTAPGIEAGAVL